MTTKYVLAAGLLAVFVIFGSVVAFTGSSGDVVTIEVQAENSRFVPEVITIPAGQTFKLVLKNRDGGEHDMEIPGVRPASQSGGGHDGHAPIQVTGPAPVAVHAQARKSASITLRIDEPGSYEFYCTIPGHKEFGMVGRLVVS